MSNSFEFEEPDHFTAGSVGPPGQRAFYLQARDAGRLLTLKTEKEHVRALADYLAGLLAQVPPPPDEEAAEDAELMEPVEAAWAVGSIGLGYDEDRGRIVVVASEQVAEEGEEGATARLSITRSQAAAFVTRARALVKAGRPLCPICSQPMDPSGHVCPRSNGHVVG